MRLTTRLMSEVAATLAVGTRLRGKKGFYKIMEQFVKDREVWKAVKITNHIIVSTLGDATYPLAD